ncbi:MAG: glycosyltransferase family 2 protein [Planctomycetes bacterium]|nr:glycosyltransferase family 2 protein [Planctomycetota bacterium]
MSNGKRELWITWAGFGLTLAATLLFAREGVAILLERAARGDAGAVVEQAIFLVLSFAIFWGSFVYLLCRRGYFKRLEAHRPVSDEELEAFLLDAPPVAFLLPSYKEDAEVVRQAIMSCALQEYPRRRVTLLIDDPCNPTNPADAAGLAAARALPARIQAQLDQEAERYRAARAAFEARCEGGALDLAHERALLAGLHDEAASWFEAQAAGHAGRAHTDRLYVEQVLLSRAARHRAQAARLRAPEAAQTTADLARGHALLAARFAVELGSFERKRYANLSHEPNKAMNLNSYLDLLGKDLREARRRDGLHLVPTEPERATLRVPDATYVVTLDADSILLPDYASRLVHIMEQRGNERVAVVQTPYSAVPGAASLVERVAGATTDMQYLIHQGFTHYDATYWVGANAVLRRAALQDIRIEVVDDRGVRVAKFIQDRTVIEDTESTIDLVERGWSLLNYPARLSYSATPPDFGALLIQRRRWANGGLLILPKLLRLVARNPLRPGALRMAFFRAHYLLSLALVNVGYLAFLFWPFEESIRSAWLPLTALPYFFLYGRDLVAQGYRWLDLPRVYALNLMLVVVHMGGVLKSLEQAVTGKLLPFQRTPKVEGRTAAPAGYVLMQAGLLAFCLSAIPFNLASMNVAHAAFSLVNGLVFAYVLCRYMGLPESAEDVRLAFAPAVASARARALRLIPRSARLRRLAVASTIGPID